MRVDVRLRDVSGKVDPRSGLTNISVHTIEIEPEERVVAFAVPYGSSEPIHELEQIAVDRLAREIVGKLHFSKIATVDGEVYRFSVQDLTYLESEEKEKVIADLHNSNENLMRSLLKVNIELNNLFEVYNYNRRPFWVKVKEYLLERKEFNREFKR